MKPLKVYVQPPAEYMGDFQWMFSLYPDRFNLVWDPDAADVHVFTGGADVHPSLYLEDIVPDAGVQCWPQRDALETAAWDKYPDKFHLGICRGSQLLNVLNGGSLWQHVNNHGVMDGHMMVEVDSGRMIQTSSVHHQMMRPGKDAKVICTASEASLKIGQYNQFKGAPEIDHEVLWYPGTRSLCIQGHPEYKGFKDFTDYSFELIERFY
jgi:hypothetical protein